MVFTAVLPSPKFHVHFVRVPAFAAEPSVKVMLLPTHAGVEVVKAAVGNGFTTTVFVAVVEIQPTADVMVSVKLNRLV